MSTDYTETFDLLQRWKAGDREALDFLLARDLEWLQQYVHRRLDPQLRRAGDTGDFVQDAVVNVLRYGPRFVLSSREQFRGLMARIVLNMMRSKHRHQHALKRSPVKEKPITSDSVLYLDSPDKSVTRPDQAAELAEEKDWVRLGLMLLAPMDHDVLDLHMQGLKDVEIGARLGVSDNTARMRRQRATGRLAKVVTMLKTNRLDDVLRQAEAADTAEDRPES